MLIKVSVEMKSGLVKLVIMLLPGRRIEQLQGCNSSAYQDSIKSMKKVVLGLPFFMLLENKGDKSRGLGQRPR